MDALQVQPSSIGELGRLCLHRRVLKEHSGGCVSTAEYYKNTRDALGGCASTAEYYRSTWDAVLVQTSPIRAPRRLCWNTTVLKEHSGG